MNKTAKVIRQKEYFMSSSFVMLFCDTFKRVMYFKGDRGFSVIILLQETSIYCR